jgi:hypothetical protein
MLAALFMLAALQSAPASPDLRVEELPNWQFRITVTRRGSNADPSALADAMIGVEVEMRTEATHHCADRGGPVAVDRGQINLLPEHRWETVRAFACRDPAAPPPAVPPPARS